MGVKIKLTSSSSVFSGVEIDTLLEDADKLKLSRILYQKLGSLTKNRELTRDDTNTTEFDRLINLLDDYSATVEDPSFKLNDTVISEIDEYLGVLGITEEYPYRKDSQFIPLWVDIESQDSERPLAVFVDGVEIDLIVDSEENQLVHLTGV